jgi:hypothetical protein
MHNKKELVLYQLFLWFTVDGLQLTVYGQWTVDGVQLMINGGQFTV